MEKLTNPDRMHASSWKTEGGSAYIHAIRSCLCDAERGPIKRKKEYKNDKGEDTKFGFVLCFGDE